MSKNLIIVESPAKVRTIKKFLGKDFAVEASVGHVRDLPTSSLGVDEEHDFAPQYQVIEGKQKVVSKLKSAAKTAGVVFLAPDPDREGEAIAWHVAELIKDKNTNIKRIQFNEITAHAVREALEHPRELDEKLFDSQQARRILDRLVGYKISPLLWSKVKRGISAGRVQSVALRMITKRERERQAFQPEEYWIFKALLEGSEPPPFTAELAKVGGKKASIGSEKEALELEEHVKNASFTVQEIKEKERSRTPPPPFITSTMQQAASQRLGYSAKKTMSTAQRLYEGVDLNERGTIALITYMRTDSVRIANEARDAAKDYIVSVFGKEWYPPKPRVFKTKAGSQDAHEAIRPVDVSLTPAEVKGQLPSDQFHLYKLIWERFVASQMAAARFWDTTVTAAAGDTLWRAKGERLLFAGFLAVMAQGKDKEGMQLPKLSEGETLALGKLDKEQKFTQPPPRYSEASLIRELEEKGIGRPSTYASIISTLLDRDYAKLEEKHFVPTELGNIVTDLLAEHFPTLMDVDFTASMEQLLDNVAEGEENWVKLLQRFTSDFYPTLEKAKEEMASVKGGVETGITCEQCGKPMVIKFGKAGQFLACSGYPDCKNTTDFVRNEKGEIEIVEREAATPHVVGTCPDCGSDLALKRARTGSRFIACTGFPKCKHAEPFSTNVACPREECPGELVEKSSRRGKIFYACNQYPQCDYATWDWPVKGPCPQCGFPILVRKDTKARGEHLACPQKSCNYIQPLGADESAAIDAEAVEAAEKTAGKTATTQKPAAGKDDKSAKKEDKGAKKDAASEKKAPAKKAPAKKAPAKKASAKKAGEEESSATPAPAKKTSEKKSTAKKTGEKKTTAAKPATKKSAATKAAASTAAAADELPPWELSDEEKKAAGIQAEANSKSPAAKKSAASKKTSAAKTPGTGKKTTAGKKTAAKKTTGKATAAKKAAAEPEDSGD